MNKKLVITIICIVILVLAIGIFAIFMMNNKGEENIQIDMAALNSEMEELGGFSEMAMQDVDKQLLSNLFGIADTSKVEEVIGKMPLINVHASMYIVVKASDGNVEYVKTALSDYGKNYEEQWSTYLPEQYELVKARQIGNKGNYVYLIISEKAEEMKNLIK